jgi:outer membrane protein OmpA-like peptidoglycan-associated protein
MDYDPTGDAVNDEDIALAGIALPGKPFEINEAPLLTAVKALKKLAPTMQRVAVFNCYIFAEVTDTSSKGIGVVASGTNGTGQIAGSASVGWFHGKSSTEQQRHVVTTVYAMNGPYTLLTAPAPEPKKGDEATVKPTAPAAQTTPPVQTIRIEVVAAPSAPPTIFSPPPTPVAATTAPEQLQLPQLSIYFSFDYPKPKDGLVIEPTVMTPDGPKDNLAAIRTIQQWLEAHPDVQIDVIGYACHRASDAYNWDLGGRRAEAVIKALNADEKIRGQVLEPDSNGKENANPSGSKEYNWRDRSVAFRVRGSDSSGR